MRTSFACKAGAAVLLALFSGNAVAQKLDRVAPLKPGSVWVNEVVSSGSFGDRRTEVESRMTEQTWEGRPTLSVQTADGTLLLDAQGDWAGLLNPQGQIGVAWEPPLSLAWPLEVGKAVTRQYTWKFPAQNRAVTVETKQAVEAYEDVTVPAGTFKAWRMRWTDSMGVDNTDWFSPDLRLLVKRIQVRTSEHPQGPGRRETQLKSHSLRLE